MHHVVLVILGHNRSCHNQYQSPIPIILIFFCIFLTVLIIAFSFKKLMYGFKEEDVDARTQGSFGGKKRKRKHKFFFVSLVPKWLFLELAVGNDHVVCSVFVVVVPAAPSMTTLLILVSTGPI